MQGCSAFSRIKFSLLAKYMAVYNSLKTNTTYTLGFNMISNNDMYKNILDRMQNCPCDFSAVKRYNSTTKQIHIIYW